MTHDSIVRRSQESFCLLPYIITVFLAIALSSDAFPREVKRCLEAGFFRYLTKRFELDALVDAIDAALRHGVEIRPTSC